MEDINVTGQIGDEWGKKAHRRAKIAKCENGFIVEYDAVRVVEVSTINHEVEKQVRTSRCTRVFIIIEDALGFLGNYFSVEVGSGNENE